MKPYDEGIEDLKYLEFNDRTEELEEAYFNGKPDCIRLPNGTILEATSYHFGISSSFQTVKFFRNMRDRSII